MTFPQRCHPRMLLSGVQFEKIRLDSRYKHAGMTNSGELPTTNTQPTYGHCPPEITSDSKLESEQIRTSKRKFETSSFRNLCFRSFEIVSNFGFRVFLVFLP